MLNFELRVFAKLKLVVVFFICPPYLAEKDCVHGRGSKIGVRANL